MHLHLVKVKSLVDIENSKDSHYSLLMLAPDMAASVLSIKLTGKPDPSVTQEASSGGRFTVNVFRKEPPPRPMTTHPVEEPCRQLV